MTNKRAIAFLQKMEEVKRAKANKQEQLQEKPIISKPSIPIEQLQSRYDYTCPRCNGFICYDTLFIDDLTGKYIALDPISLRPHHCGKKGNGIINVE